MLGLLGLYLQDLIRPSVEHVVDPLWNVLRVDSIGINNPSEAVARTRFYTFGDKITPTLQLCRKVPTTTRSYSKE